jgi:hypothetical protein
MAGMAVAAHHQRLHVRATAHHQRLHVRAVVRIQQRLRHRCRFNTVRVQAIAESQLAQDADEFEDTETDTSGLPPLLPRVTPARCITLLSPRLTARAIAAWAPSADSPQILHSGRHRSTHGQIRCGPGRAASSCQAASNQLHVAAYVRVRPAYAGEGRYFVRVPEGAMLLHAAMLTWLWWHYRLDGTRRPP